MAIAEVNDYVLWAKHIRGDDGLLERVKRLKGGESIALKVEGFAGEWLRMADGADGRPTHGLRPVDRMKRFWRELYESRPGALVSVEIVEDIAVGPGTGGGGAVTPPLARSQVEREAALHALLNLAGQGWRSDGRIVTREELYDR